MLAWKSFVDKELLEVSVELASSGRIDGEA